MFPAPLFKQFGQSLIDLFNAGFEYRHQLRVQGKTVNGINVASSVQTGPDGTSIGAVSLREDCLNIELDTADSQRLGLISRLPNLPGSTLNFSADSTPSVGGSIDYAEANFSTSFGAYGRGNRASLEWTGALASQGMAVGASVKHTLNGFESPDYNAAIQWTHNNVTAALTTSDCMTKYMLGAMSTIRDATVGVCFKSDLFSPKPFPSASVAVELKPSKVKLDSNGNLAMVTEHALLHPAVKLSLSTEFHVTRLLAPPKFGVSLVLGEGDTPFSSGAAGSTRAALVCPHCK